jgi:hypothetical protein
MRFFEFMKPLGMVLGALLIAGCEGQPGGEPSSVAYTTRGMDASASMPMSPPAMPREKAEDVSKSPQGEVATKSPTAGRKIIYNARMDLVTEDLNKLESALMKLIAANNAYVADSDRTGSAGSTRRGSWKIRVPVDLYDPLVQGAMKLGELVSVKADTQDVSEEFFDLEAREAAKKVEETRLLKHLSDSTGKLEEILAVEKELSRVRSEIERMEGRLRYLANLTSLATVTVTASEIKGYVPPQSPTLGTKLARSFAGSVETLKELGETLLIGIVAVMPWLPLIAVGLVLVVWIAKRVAARMPVRSVFVPVSTSE